MSVLSWLWPQKAEVSRRVDPVNDLVDTRNPPRRVFRTEVFYVIGEQGTMMTIRTSDMMSEEMLLSLRSGNFDIPASEGFSRVIGVNLRVTIIIPNAREV